MYRIDLEFPVRLFDNIRKTERSKNVIFQKVFQYDKTISNIRVWNAVNFVMLCVFSSIFWSPCKK